MMQNRSYIALGIMATIFIGFLLYTYSSRDKYSWAKTYRTKEKAGQPYDIDILFKIMPSYAPKNQFYEIDKDEKFTLPDLDSVKTSNTNYIFIGNRLFIDSVYIDKLMNYVAHGNSAFLIMEELPFQLVDTLFQSHCLNWSGEFHHHTIDSTVNINLYHENLYRDSGYTFNAVLRNKITNKSWSYLNTEDLCDDFYTIVPLGEVQGHINFYKKSYGKGNFFFHSTPIAFTNYQLVHNKDARPYVEAVFSHLQPGAIYWDNKSKYRNYDNDRQRNNIQVKDSPFAYLLSQPALRWAWYTLLSMVLLFFIFGSKRKQRIIPVLSKSENTSLAFIRTIGQMHYQSGNHHTIAQKQQKHFLTFVKNKFKIPVDELDEGFVVMLAEKATMNKDDIQKLVTYVINIQSSKFVSEDALINFHVLVNQFYKHCK